MENRRKGLSNCWVQKERENNSKLSPPGFMAVKTKQRRGLNKKKYIPWYREYNLMICKVKNLEENSP